jgi:hypothetical protein
MNCYISINSKKNFHQQNKKIIRYSGYLGLYITEKIRERDYFLFTLIMNMIDIAIVASGRIFLWIPFHPQSAKLSVPQNLAPRLLDI